MICIVDDAKIKDYLLNLNHPDGVAKARFFLAGGFTAADPAPFVEALRQHFLDHELKPTTMRTVDNFGCTRIIVDAPMQVPDGRTPKVRTVWKLDAGEPVPRLITAYPID